MTLLFTWKLSKNEKGILTMIGSESHPMPFENLRHTVYTYTTKASCTVKVIMNLNLEIVFQLQTLLYIQNLMLLNSVIYIDKTQIAAITQLLCLVKVIFWDLFMFYQIFFSPLVKRCTIISYKHGIYEFPHKLPNDLRLRILGN